MFIGFVLGRVNLANASLLYLLAVLATAVAVGRGPAIFAAVCAFLVFDWFFVEPLHTSPWWIPRSGSRCWSFC